ncbi:MAG: TetR/AcrR family transcriptional regulator [Gemmatimonadota bacterium]
MESGGRRAEKKAETRAALLEAALELFERDGFAGTTVDAIAERAGVSRATYFNYYETKEGVLIAYYRGVLEGELNRLEEAVARDTPARRFFEEQFEMGLRTAHREGERFRVLFREVFSNRRVLEANQELAARVTTIYFAAIQGAVTRGELRSDLDVAGAVGVLGAVWSSTLVERLYTPLDLDTLIQRMRAKVDIVFRGIVGSG